MNETLLFCGKARGSGKKPVSRVGVGWGWGVSEINQEEGESPFAGRTHIRWKPWRCPSAPTHPCLPFLLASTRIKFVVELGKAPPGSEDRALDKEARDLRSGPSSGEPSLGDLKHLCFGESCEASAELRSSLTPCDAGTHCRGGT